MQYDVYGYHSRRAEDILTPRSGNFNIKGVELEINDSSYDVRETLDDMIERRLLYAPEMNGYNSPTPIVISDDGSVYRELIIKACGNQRLLQTIKMLDNELNGVVDNTSNTSCHIHVNKSYLRKLGIQTSDMFKTAEWLAPILFRISERDHDTQYDWAKTYIGDIDEKNLFERAIRVDNLNMHNDGPGRYYILNCRPGRSSAEFRIFSNHCNFNYETIKLYIETVDFMINMCQYMLGKSYKNEYETLIKETEKFFRKRNHKKFFDKYNMKDFFKTQEELKIELLERQKRELINKFNSIRNNQEYESKTRTMMRLIRILRDYQFELPSIELLYDGNDIDRVQNILLQDLETMVNNQ